MDFPKLRQVEAFPIDVSGQRLIGLRDPMNFSPEIVAVPPALYMMLVLMDGHHSIVDMQAEYMRANGEMIFREVIEELLEKLDTALFLENDRFKSVREKIRESRLVAAVTGLVAALPSGLAHSPRHE